MRRQSLTAKSGISNHAAAGIRDDPCLSKFGHSVSVQTWPRHGMGCQPRHGRNTRILLQRICRRLFILELFVLWYSCNITYHFKEIFAYCDNFLYFAHRCAKHCTKILKLSFAVRTLPIACSKLGKTRTIADVRTAWLETAGFAIESRLPAIGRIRRISPAAVIIYQSAPVSAASRGLEDYRHLGAHAFLA